MKRYKLLTALLIALIAVILAACGTDNSTGDAIPDNMNPDIYASGKQAVRLVEDYEAGNITIEECFNSYAPLIDYLDTIEVTDDQKESAIAVIGYVNAIGYDLTMNEDYEEDLTGLKNILGV